MGIYAYKCVCVCLCWCVVRVYIYTLSFTHLHNCPLNLIESVCVRDEGGEGRGRTSLCPGVRQVSGVSRRKGEGVAHAETRIIVKP